MKLPVELRLQIFEEVIRETRIPQTYWIGNKRHFEYPIEIWGRTGGPAERPHFLPAICRTSRWILEETIAFFIRNSTFWISTSAGNHFFQQFLASIPDGFAHVRSLHLCLLARSPLGDIGLRNGNFRLAQKCPNLRTLHLEFHHGRLFRLTPYARSLPRQPCSVQKNFERYHLGMLLECRSLTGITLRGLRSRYSMFLGLEEHCLDEMAWWMKGEFAQKGQMVQTSYVVADPSNEIFCPNLSNPEAFRHDNSVHED